MTVLALHDVGKRFRTFDAERPWTLQEAVASGFRKWRSRGERWGVRHVQLELGAGRAIGVIGRNGAGKSTLLRLAGGVLHPDEGSVTVHGRVGGLLELTAGFHPDLTGRENALIGGVLRGLTRREMQQRLPQVVAFAELEAAIDRPIRTFSSGMQMRLAFAVAVHCEPELLLVDEVLAVGDADFQSKCMARIRLLRSNGCAIVLVSHELALIEQVCEDTLWMANGEVAMLGPTHLVLPRYLGALSGVPAETGLPSAADLLAAHA
jgi:lipopolysaccharide transport system ATP-binding protein